MRPKKKRTRRKKEKKMKRKYSYVNNATNSSDIMQKLHTEKSDEITNLLDIWRFFLFVWYRRGRWFKFDNQKCDYS